MWVGVGTKRCRYVGVEVGRLSAHAEGARTWLTKRTLCAPLRTQQQARQPQALTTRSRLSSKAAMAALGPPLAAAAAMSAASPAVEQGGAIE